MKGNMLLYFSSSTRLTTTTTTKITTKTSTTQNKHNLCLTLNKQGSDPQLDLDKLRGRFPDLYKEAMQRNCGR